MNRSKSQKSRPVRYLITFLLAILFYRDFSAFLIIYLYFLILAFISYVFLVIAKPAIPTDIPTKEGSSEMETHPLTIEAKISKWSV